VGVEGERVGLLDPGQQLPPAGGKDGWGPEGAVDVEPQPLGPAQPASSASGSTLPVLVVPEVATTQNGRRPAARSAATAAATVAGGSRNWASFSSRRTWAGWRPSMPAARPIQEWVWSEA
jgi:hypothetical protein